MPPNKTTISKDRPRKVYYNPEMDDTPFPELTNYKFLVGKPESLEDINGSEGTKLTGIENGATANYGALADLDAVGADQILTNAVTELKISAQAVTNAKIAVNAIQGDVIAASAITETKVASDAISTPKLQTGAIVAGKIATGAVTTDKIYALAVTSEKIAAYSITSDKVTTGQLITLSAQIANAVINDAHINNLTVEKLTGTYLTGKTVRTASSGKRVEIRGSNNDIAFYDSSGNLGGTILGQSGQIYISGEGLGVECPLYMEAEFVPDTVTDLIPTISNAYNLGASSYYWGKLFIKFIEFYSYSSDPGSRTYGDMWHHYESGGGPKNFRGCPWNSDVYTFDMTAV